MLLAAPSRKPRRGAGKTRVCSPAGAVRAAGGGSGHGEGGCPRCHPGGWAPGDLAASPKAGQPLWEALKGETGGCGSWGARSRTCALRSWLWGVPVGLLVGDVASSCGVSGASPGRRCRVLRAGQKCCLWGSSGEASGRERRSGADPPTPKEQKGWEPFCSQGRKCQGWVAGWVPASSGRGVGGWSRRGGARWVLGSAALHPWAKNIHPAGGTETREARSPLLPLSPKACAHASPPPSALPQPLFPPPMPCGPLGAGCAPQSRGAAVRQQPTVPSPSTGPGGELHGLCTAPGGVFAGCRRSMRCLRGREGRRAEPGPCGGTGRGSGPGVCAWWRLRDCGGCRGDGDAGSYALRRHGRDRNHRLMGPISSVQRASH